MSNNILNAFKPDATPIPAVLQYNELAGENYFRFIVGGVDEDGDWSEDMVVSLPGVYLQFPIGKEPVHVNYAMTKSPDDPVVVLGWDNPSEEMVTNINKAHSSNLRAYKQPSKARNFIPVVTCNGPKDKSLDGLPNLLAISDAQMRTLRDEVKKLSNVVENNNPLGMLITFEVDAKAKKPADKYKISVAANKADATEEDYSAAVKAITPLLINVINGETRLCGGPSVYQSSPDVAAAKVWEYIESETNMTKSDLVDKFYVGMTPRVDPVGESLTNPEVDFA